MSASTTTKKRSLRHNAEYDIEEAPVNDQLLYDELEEAFEEVLYEVPRELSQILEENVKMLDICKSLDALKLRLSSDNGDATPEIDLQSMANLLVELSEVYDSKILLADKINSKIEELGEVSKRSATTLQASYSPPPSESSSWFPDNKRRRRNDSKPESGNTSYKVKQEEINLNSSTSMNSSLNNNQSYPLTRSKFDKLRRHHSYHQLDKSPRSPLHGSISVENSALKRSSSISFLETSNQSIENTESEDNEENNNTIIKEESISETSSHFKDFQSINNAITNNTDPGLLSDHSEHDGDEEESEEAKEIKPKEEGTQVYCLCRKDMPDQPMVACDNQKCDIEWFHFKCVELKVEPKGKWYCFNCRINKNTYNKPKPKLKRR